jgi:phage terminase small subunit
MKMTDEQKIMFDELTRLQKACAMERLKDPMASNGTIYIRATKKMNITNHSARVYGHNVLNHADVVAFLDTFNVEASDESIMGREELMLRLSKIARHQLDDVVQIIHPEQQMMDVESGEIYEGQTAWAIRRDADMSLVTELTKGKDGLKVKTHSATEAMKQLAALQGFNAPAKTELSGPGGAAIQIHDLSDDDFALKLAALGLGDGD